MIVFITRPAGELCRYSVNDISPDLPKRVLLVDDDESTLASYARMLRLEGYLVSTAVSARDAFVEIESHSPDAILLDLRMPTTDGVGFLRELRAMGAHTPVAIVTGVIEMDESLQSALRELHAIVRWKPLWLEDLVVLVTTLLVEGPSDRPAGG